MEPLLLRPAEAAKLLGIGRTLCYQLIKAGEIPHRRVGKAIRIPAAALKSWAEDGISAGTDPVADGTFNIDSDDNSK